MQTNRDYYFVNKDIYYQFGCSFYETSAAHRQHVDDVFHTLVRDIRQTHRQEKERKKKKKNGQTNIQNNKQGNKERRKNEIKNVFIFKIHIKQNNNKKVKAKIKTMLISRRNNEAPDLKGEEEDEDTTPRPRWRKLWNNLFRRIMRGRKSIQFFLVFTSGILFPVSSFYFLKTSTKTLLHKLKENYTFSLKKKHKNDYLEDFI